MPRTIVSITNTDDQENAIALFVNKSTGLKCFFEGYEFKRIRPYALANVTTSKKAGTAWTTQELVNGITTTFSKDASLIIDIDIYTDTYDSKGAYIKESSKYYMEKFSNNYDFDDNKTDLEAQGMKITTLNQIIGNTSIKEEDKWIKHSNVECTFNYSHQFKIVDSDTITDVAEPTINLDQ